MCGADMAALTAFRTAKKFNTYWLLAGSKLTHATNELQLIKSYRTSVAAAAAAADRDLLHRSILPTDYFQKSLPRLPIPKLDDTCNRYIAALTPLLSPDELERTKKLVECFRNGEGRALQKILIARQKQNKQTCFLKDKWFESYFLQDRKPLVLHHSPFLVMEDDPRAEYMNQLVRATNFIVSSLRFVKTMRANVLDPEVFHLNPKKTDNERYRRVMRMLPRSLATYGSYLYKAYPLNLSQIVNLFNTSRIPRLGKDEHFTDPSARHLLVLSKGNLFVFDPFDNNGYIRPAAEIFAELQQIASGNAAEHSLGFLTCENRDVWAEMREKLEKAGNAETLRLIDSAIFALTLDDVEIKDYKELLHRALCGDGANRWFDKSVMVIVTKDGHTAVNFEHASAVGMSLVRYLLETHKDSVKNPSFSPGTRPSAVNLTFRKLNINWTDELKSAVDRAREGFNATASKVRIDHWRNVTLVREYWKQNKLSGDAMMQLAFQMAYCKMTGERAVSTYEACSTGAFKHGFVETIRPATLATARACTMFHASELKRPSPAELRACLQECSEKHKQLTKEASMGQGFDIHLYILKLIAAENGGKLPAIFDDRGYELINHEIMATSSLPFPCFSNGGFGPWFNDSLGIGYGCRSEFSGFSVVAYTSGPDVHQFVAAFNDSMNEIQSVVDTTHHC